MQREGYTKFLQTQNKIPALTKYPLLISLLFEASLGFLALVLSYFFHIYPWEVVYWRLSDLYLAFLASLCFFAFFIIFYHLPYTFARRIRIELEEALGSLFIDFDSLKIFLLAFSAGIGEELLFRGFLQKALEESFQPWLALLISNFFFAMAHWITPFYALFAGILGLLLGFAMLYSQNLLVPILIHSFYDFAALYYFIKSPSTRRRL